jgi:2-keto-3-deoxy-L-rhamnonate aldolase
LLYNFPGVANGIDLDSDFILEAASHPNIVGTKLTCCNIGKLQRISSNVSKSGGFSAIVGKSEAFLPGLVAGSGGLIGALVNLTPRTHVELLRLYDNGQLQEAQKLQAAISDADYAIVKLGVPGLKSAVDKYFGYGGGRSRKPLGKIDARSWAVDTVTKVEKIMHLEATLGGTKATAGKL